MWRGQTGHCVTITESSPLFWPGGHLLNLTVQHFSSEQDSTQQTCRYYRTTAVGVRVFWNVMYLICYATPSFDMFGDNAEAHKKTKLQSFHRVAVKSAVQLLQIGWEYWTQSPGNSTRRFSRKIACCWHCLVVNNWRTLRWTNCRGYLQKEECPVSEI